MGGAGVNGVCVLYAAQPKRDFIQLTGDGEGMSHIHSFLSVATLSLEKKLQCVVTALETGAYTYFCPSSSLPSCTLPSTLPSLSLPFRSFLQVPQGKSLQQHLRHLLPLG